MPNRSMILLAAVLVLTAPVQARELEESPAPFSLTPLHPGTPGVPLASSLSVPAVAGVPATPGTIGAAAAIAAPAGGITGVAQIATTGGPMVAPMGGALAGISPVVGAPIATASLQAAPAVGSALASYNGFYYPGHSMLVSYSSDLLANTDGRVFMHPAFPGHLMYYNSNEGRWCYQDSRSMSGWFFVPREIFIAPPQ
jgi:hypothetical protein